MYVVLLRYGDVLADFELHRTYLASCVPSNFFLHFFWSFSYLSLLHLTVNIFLLWILQVASFRKKARVPVLSYLYPNGSSLTRCSQPSVGLKRARNVHDENLFRAIQRWHLRTQTQACAIVFQGLQFRTFLEFIWVSVLLTQSEFPDVTVTLEESYTALMPGHVLTLTQTCPWVLASKRAEITMRKWSFSILKTFTSCEKVTTTSRR